MTFAFPLKVKLKFDLSSKLIHSRDKSNFRSVLDKKAAASRTAARFCEHKHRQACSVNMQSMHGGRTKNGALA